MSQVNTPLLGQENGIPGYPCYRTVEETYASMDTLVANYPNLVSKVDIGDSWDKMTPGGPSGYDLFVLVLTNNSRPSTGKARFFLMAEIHAREYTTAETAMRYAEYLTANYGTNPDITWMLDYNEVHILVMSNPDGRKFAETVEWWRKNTNNTNGCTTLGYYGTYLNRNSSFHWGTAGTDPCGETYQGPVIGSEPETQAMQNYVANIFIDQRGPGDTDPAPLTATGMFVTLHSFADVNIFPWGWTSAQAPNYTQMNTLGRKLGYFNGYEVCQSNSDCMYETHGTSDDWAYGTLGIAAYTVEMGSQFFETCSNFTTNVWPKNRDMLVYAIKAARLPYMNPGGPDATTLALSVSPVQGEPVTLTAKADDTCYYSGGHGNEPTYPIAEARYSIDSPSWAAGATTYPMTPSDGAFDRNVENIQATIETTGLSVGRHIIFVEAKVAQDKWGSPTAIFLDVYPFALTPPTAGGQAYGGDSATYNLNVANIGSVADTYTVTFTNSNGWAVVAPATVGPVAAGANADFQVTVPIPAGYFGGVADVTTVTLTSGGPVHTAQSTTLTTTTLYHYFYLPAIGKGE